MLPYVTIAHYIADNVGIEAALVAGYLGHMRTPSTTTSGIARALSLSESDVNTALDRLVSGGYIHEDSLAASPLLTDIEGRDYGGYSRCPLQIVHDGHPPLMAYLVGRLCAARPEMRDIGILARWAGRDEDEVADQIEAAVSLGYLLHKCGYLICGVAGVSDPYARELQVYCNSVGT